MKSIPLHIATLCAGIAIGMLIALRACCPCAETGGTVVQKITMHKPEQVADVPATLTLPETSKRPKRVFRGRITRPENKPEVLPETGSAIMVVKADSAAAADTAQEQLAACPEFVAVSDTTTFVDGSRAAATYTFPANTFAFWYKAAADTTTTTTIRKRPFSITVGVTAVLTPLMQIKYGVGITAGIDLWSL